MKKLNNRQEKDNGFVKEFDRYLKRTIVHKCGDVLKAYSAELRREDPVIYVDDLDTLSGYDPTREYDKVKVVLGGTSFMADDERLVDAISLLNERYQMILDLAIFDEQSNKAIAELMQLEEKTIRNYKSKALAILRRYLEEEAGNE